MLQDAEVMAMIPVKDVKSAETFYTETLGLHKVDENMAGITYKCGNGKVFVYQTPEAGSATSTVVTWTVSDIGKVVEALSTSGLKFEHYDFPGAVHEGEVHIMGNMKAAWFRDPDGNILGLSEAA